VATGSPVRRRDCAELFAWRRAGSIEDRYLPRSSPTAGARSSRLRSEGNCQAGRGKTRMSSGPCEARPYLSEASDRARSQDVASAKAQHLVSLTAAQK